MKVILFGATGMVGQSVLRECLLDPGVESVLSISRRPLGQEHKKLKELVAADLFDLSADAEKFRGYGACFFCLGVSSAGMSEAAYRRITKDMTLSVAHLLAGLNPKMTFTYVSGIGTDSTEKGRIMWARVKGETENELARLFESAYMFRIGMLQPMYGIRGSSRGTRALYAFLGPFIPLAKRLFPNQISTTEQLGRAMIAVARRGAAQHVLEPHDINALASAGAA